MKRIDRIKRDNKPGMVLQKNLSGFANHIVNAVIRPNPFYPVHPFMYSS